MNVKEVEYVDDNIKSVVEFMDDSPILTGEMFNLVNYIKSRYFCTAFDAIRSIVPMSSKTRVDAVLSLDEAKFDLLKDKMSIEEYDLSLKIKNEKRDIKGRILKNLESQYELLLKRLKELEIIKISYCNKKLNCEKSDVTITVSSGFLDVIKFTLKQKNVIDFVKSRGNTTIKEICYFTGESERIINTLLKKGVLQRFYNKESSSKHSACVLDKKDIYVSLTKIQKEVCDEIKLFINENKPHVSLLHGITGSGKTMVIMALMDFVIQKGKSVIFMVPEISLTSQLATTFKSHYGDNIAILHSGLSDPERIRQWDRIKNGEAKVVIGTRTAVFAPTKKLGLIIMDEEHETTYKSESSPRFHARDIAYFRCKINDCTLLLSSATPSIESFFLAKSGVYSLHSLNQRYGNAILPKTEIIDMNCELMEGNPTLFGGRLIEIIEEEISKGKQSILLLNRRGYHTFVKCKDCKEALVCPNCNITLNYHRTNNRLMCHYCGYSIEFLRECPKCHGVNMSYSGIGTQRAEFQLQELIPNARILRIDADKIISTDSYNKLFKDFSSYKYDIMIGTQMVSKGLNFPNVTLVGVLMADQALYSDDFRSYERAFSLITQVVGRSGRGDSLGRAIIQTYTPENPIIGMAARQDYEKFYQDEIQIRKQMLYPPFSDLCIIGFTGKNEKKVESSSKEFFEGIKNVASERYKNIPIRMFNPSAACISKMCGNYRYKILIKCRINKDFYRLISEIMLQYERKINSKGVNVFIDVNPTFVE